MYDTSEFTKAVGGLVLGVEREGDTIVLCMDTGRLRLSLDAECCSASMWTDVGQFDELIGHTIRAIEERDDGTPPKPEVAADDDCTSWHFLVFTTDAGHVTIDWRNNSNGFYDGICNGFFEPIGAEA